MSSRPIQKRFLEHRNKRVKSTKMYQGNVILVYAECIEVRTKHEGFKQAFEREKKIKHMSTARKKKLIETNKEKTKQLIDKYFDL